MNKKGQELGLIGGLAKLIGGVVFVWLLLTMYGSGAMIGFAGSKGIVMLGIFLIILWIITRKTK